MARVVKIKDLGNGRGYSLDVSKLVFPSRREAEVVKKAVDQSLIEAEKLQRQALKAIKATAEFLEIPEEQAAKRLGIELNALNKEQKPERQPRAEESS